MGFNELVVIYGAQVSLIGIVAIFLVGCIKIALKKRFEQLDRNACKTIYETLSIVMSFGLTALWMATRGPVFGLDSVAMTWEAFAKEGALSFAAVKVMYPLYENYRLRDLFKIIGQAVVGIFKKDKSGSDNDVTVI